jgi:hypothetical protein
MKKKDFKLLLKSIDQARFCHDLDELWDKKTVKMLKDVEPFDTKGFNKHFKTKWYNTLIYHLYYRWVNKLERLPNLIERAYYGIGHEDVWDLDGYISRIMIKGLKQLKKNSYSIPNEIYETYRIRTDLTEKEKDRLAVKEWKNKIQIMINGFEAYLNFLTHIGMNKKQEIIYKLKIERGLQEFKSNFYNLND